VTIGQDARLYAGLSDNAESITHELSEERLAWLHLARGELVLNGQPLGAGDGAAIRGERKLSIERGKGAEFVLWDLSKF
jgi:redox-sensitive bicupin YhaK (pirin superfamily)